MEAQRGGGAEAREAVPGGRHGVAAGDAQARRGEPVGDVRRRAGGQPHLVALLGPGALGGREPGGEPVRVLQVGEDDARHPVHRGRSHGQRHPGDGELGGAALVRLPQAARGAQDRQRQRGVDDVQVLVDLRGAVRCDGGQPHPALAAQPLQPGGRGADGGPPPRRIGERGPVEDHLPVGPQLREIELRSRVSAQIERDDPAAVPARRDVRVVRPVAADRPEVRAHRFPGAVHGEGQAHGDRPAAGRPQREGGAGEHDRRRGGRAQPFDRGSGVERGDRPQPGRVDGEDPRAGARRVRHDDGHGVAAPRIGGADGGQEAVVRYRRDLQHPVGADLGLGPVQPRGVGPHPVLRGDPAHAGGRGEDGHDPVRRRAPGQQQRAEPGGDPAPGQGRAPGGDGGRQQQAGQQHGGGRGEQDGGEQFEAEAVDGRLAGDRGLVAGGDREGDDGEVERGPGERGPARRRGPQQPLHRGAGEPPVGRHDEHERPGPDDEPGPPRHGGADEGGQRALPGGRGEDPPASRPAQCDAGRVGAATLGRIPGGDPDRDPPDRGELHGGDDDAVGDRVPLGGDRPAQRLGALAHLQGVALQPRDRGGHRGGVAPAELRGGQEQVLGRVGGHPGRGDRVEGGDRIVAGLLERADDGQRERLPAEGVGVLDRRRAQPLGQGGGQHHLAGPGRAPAGEREARAPVVAVPQLGRDPLPGRRRDEARELDPGQGPFQREPRRRLGRRAEALQRLVRVGAERDRAAHGDRALGRRGGGDQRGRDPGRLPLGEPARRGERARRERDEHRHDHGGTTAGADGAPDDGQHAQTIAGPRTPRGIAPTKWIARSGAARSARRRSQGLGSGRRVEAHLGSGVGAGEVSGAQRSASADGGLDRHGRSLLEVPASGDDFGGLLGEDDVPGPIAGAHVPSIPMCGAGRLHPSVLIVRPKGRGTVAALARTIRRRPKLSVSKLRNFRPEVRFFAPPACCEALSRRETFRKYSGNSCSPPTARASMASH
ncbi:hypothetical protein ACQP1P_27170 [Dactylosporangium sp. CA-052675]|uniref:hypothetical protein n=1 Tax=Dactylosporangium sp. CA-052675 TaxID=3239927 RepID=UPI003D8B92EF